MPLDHVTKMFKGIAYQGPMKNSHSGNPRGKARRARERSEEKRHREVFHVRRLTEAFRGWAQTTRERLEEKRHGEAFNVRRLTEAFRGWAQTTREHSEEKRRREAFNVRRLTEAFRGWAQITRKRSEEKRRREAFNVRRLTEAHIRWVKRRRAEMRRDAGVVVGHGASIGEPGFDELFDFLFCRDESVAQEMPVGAGTVGVQAPGYAEPRREFETHEEYAARLFG
jgi:uncharacterized protein YktA (UPF0223 family)